MKKLQYFIFADNGNTLLESAQIETSISAKEIATDFYGEEENQDLGLVLIDLESKQVLYNSKEEQQNA